MRWGRAAALGVAALALAAVAGGFAFRRPMAEAAFQRGVEGNLGGARVAALPDGLHVFVCGSGGPMPDPTRAGPCLAVLAGERGFVFDVGSGSARVLGRMGFPMARLDRVFLTHLHSDHIDGLGELTLQAWVGGGRDAPLPVMGPSGVEEVVSGFNAAYRIDSSYRVAHHGPEVANPTGFGASAERIDAPPEGASVIFDDGEARISVITVDHAPASPAFGYLIAYKGRSVAISGDTAFSENFIAAAQGVDVMFHEALAPDLVLRIAAAADARGQANIAKIMRDIPDYHASPEEAARAAQSANADALVLYHIVPPLPSAFLNPAFLGDARRAFSGRLMIGEDGMLVSLPAGGDSMRVERWR
ncbi:MAG: MBL fold metallo-hydrolase [Alphaproteobacteria bacterium]|nr:MBL fold metallo-hydrolase [Alphaproteobacteria bacterium]